MLLLYLTLFSIIRLFLSQHTVFTLIVPIPLWEDEEREGIDLLCDVPFPAGLEPQQWLKEISLWETMVCLQLLVGAHFTYVSRPLDSQNCQTLSMLA